MKMKPLLTKIAGCLVLLLVLAACSSTDDDDTANQPDKSDKVEKVNKDKALPPPICPQVAILRTLEGIKDYGAEKPDPAQLVSAARMLSVNGSCAYDEDAGGIDVTFDLNFVAQKGPRLGGLRTTFPYFVAVVDPDDKVLNKEKMTVNVGFSSSEQTNNTAESLHVFIPLSKDKWKTGPDYRVLMGFQLTKEQFDALSDK